MKNLKKFICGALAVAAVSTGITAMAEEDTISVLLDNDKVVFEDQQPVIIEGSTLVPVRAVFEQAGAEVSWNQDTLTATLVKGNYTVTITLNDTVLYKNGTAVALNTPATMINNRILIPVRAIGEAMDFNVKWDGFHSSVFISTDGTEYRPYAARRVAFKDLPDIAEFYSANTFANAEVDLDGDGVMENVSFAKKYENVLSGEPALIINGKDLTIDLEGYSSTYSFAVVDINRNDTTKEVIITENGDTLTAHFYQYNGERLVPLSKNSQNATLSYVSRLLFDGRSYMLSDKEGICFTDIMVAGSAYQLEGKTITQYKVSNASKIVPRTLVHTYNDNMIYNYVEVSEFVPGTYRNYTFNTITAAELDQFKLVDMYIDGDNPAYFEFYIELTDGRHIVLTPYSV